MSNEEMKDSLRDVQHYLTQAMGILLDVKEKMSEVEHYQLSRVEKEVDALNDVDMNIGRIISGRS